MLLRAQHHQHIAAGDLGSSTKIGSSYGSNGSANARGKTKTGLTYSHPNRRIRIPTADQASDIYPLVEPHLASPFPPPAWYNPGSSPVYLRHAKWPLP